MMKWRQEQNIAIRVQQMEFEVLKGLRMTELCIQKTEIVQSTL